jgi:hypothetical protein
LFALRGVDRPELIAGAGRSLPIGSNPTGFVTSQSDEWEILNLPAIAEAEEVIPISDTRVHRRRVGEALSPVREPCSRI